MWIELNPTERRLATFLAKARAEANRAKGIEDKKVGPQSGELTDLEGIGAEIAFCRMMNVYPDLSVDHHPDSDATIYPGGRVDVKATRYENGRLLAVTGKKGKAPDIYALMVGTFPRYRCAGLISAQRLLDDERLVDLGYGQTYAAQQSELQPVEHLMQKRAA